MLNQNFYKSTPIYLACEVNGYRPVMSYVLFKEGYAWASDGHIAVRCKISELSNFNEGAIALLENSLIHSTALKEIYKSKGEVFVEKRQVSDGKETKEFPVFVVRNDFSRIEYPCKMNGDGMRFPSIDKVFAVRPEESKVSFTFNPKQMATLVKAMGLSSANDHCTIKFSENYNACLVKSQSSPVEGLIMPIME